MPTNSQEIAFGNWLEFSFGSLAALSPFVRLTTASGRIAELKKGRARQALIAVLGQERSFAVFGLHPLTDQRCIRNDDKRFQADLVLLDQTSIVG